MFTTARNIVCLSDQPNLPVGRAPALPACRSCRPGGCGGGAETQILLSQSFPPDRSTAVRRNTLFSFSSLPTTGNSFCCFSPRKIKRDVGPSGPSLFRSPPKTARDTCFVYTRPVSYPALVPRLRRCALTNAKKEIQIIDRKSGEKNSTRYTTCWSASPGRCHLPGLAGQHLPEDAVFPDLLASISRKMPSSPTCWSASLGKCHLPGLAGQHLSENAIFPDLLASISRKMPSSRTCWPASLGSTLLAASWSYPITMKAVNSLKASRRYR